MSTAAAVEMSPEDRNALVVKYRPLAYKLAKKLYYAHAEIEALGDLDDVKQEAVIALIEAVKRDRPERGYSLATLVRLMVKQHLWDLVKDQARDVRAEGTPRPDLIPDTTEHPLDEWDQVEAALSLLSKQDRYLLTAAHMRSSFQSLNPAWAKNDRTRCGFWRRRATAR
jgi:RNA polymerase sigma factor (sigma-70 family)